MIKECVTMDIVINDIIDYCSNHDRLYAVSPTVFCPNEIVGLRDMKNGSLLHEFH